MVELKSATICIAMVWPIIMMVEDTTRVCKVKREPNNFTVMA